MALKLNRKKIGRNVALFVCLCGLLGAIEFFLPASLALYSLQTKASKDNVSGEIIVVGIDSQSIKAVGRWPWSRETQAQLLRAIDEYNPKSIYVDIGYQGRTTANADSALREAISNTKAPTTVIALATTDGDGDVQTIYSHPAAVGTAPFVTAHSPYLFGYIWSLPTTLKAPRGQLQSVAANIAGRPVPENTNFRVNYSLNPDSIPIYRAKDIMTKAVDPSKLAGKTVILGVTDKTQNDVHSMPAWGERPGVAFHVLGAETLKRGYPIEAGWIPFFLLATAVCVALLTAKGLHYSTHITIACSILILVISTFLTTQHIGNDPFPSILLLVISGVYIARQKAALLRSQRDPKTGLSDMTGYMVDEVMANTWFVGATPLVATSLRSYIAPEDEIQIAKEIAKRLSTIIDERQLAHNGNQQFLWEMPPIATGELAAHLEGLRRLFSSPIKLDNRQIEIDMFFGVDRNVTASIKERANDALRASEEAKGLSTTYKITASQSFEDYLCNNFATEFQAAIANGSAQLMLEPEKDLASGNITSAEASLRWTHPAHGQISTTQLIDLGRKSGCLAIYTTSLCELAIRSAAKIERHNPSFNTTIKVAAEMIVDVEIQAAIISEAQKNLRSPANITFEIVNIHANQSNSDLMRAIRTLQAHRFQVGIGDFGLSNSDIDLITHYRPNALYLAKSFSAELLGSKSNSIFAEAAMRIAKLNNMKIVADDVDDRAVLTALIANGCDFGKGKIIGIPMNQIDFINSYLVRNAKDFG